MQTRFRFLGLAAVSLLLILTSCSKSNKQGRYIPGNAAIAVVVNGESISTKLPWEEVKQTEWFKMIYTDTTLDAFLKSALDNPDNTGIDTKKDLIFFAVKDSIGGYIAFEGTIKDENMFKKFLGNLSQGAKETEKDGVKLMTIQQVTASWKDGRIVVAGNAPFLDQAKAFGMARSSGSNINNREMIPVCLQIHDLAEDKSLAKEDKMTDLMKQKGDMHFWMNSESLNNGSLANAALSMLNLSKLYEGSYTTGVVNFDNGQINMDFKSYSGKEMTEITKKYSGTSINEDMIKRIPAKNIAVLFSLNFKPEGVKEFLKLAGLDGFANMGTAYLGFNVDDFIKANKGDIMFCLSDIKSDTLGRPDLNVLFSAAIGDKDAFNKLVAAGNKLGKEEMGGGMNDKIFYNMNKEYFAIGSKKESVDQYIAGSNKSSIPVLEKISGNPIAAYINVQYLIRGIGESEVRDSLTNVIYQASLNFWQDVIISGGKFKDGAIDQHIEINLIDKNSNSLKLLNKYLSMLADVSNKKKAMVAEQMAIDEPVAVVEEP